MPLRSQFATAEQFSEALRDWFAGQALSGLMASKAISGTADSPEIVAERKRKAVSCYLLADALLAERESPPTPQTNRN